MSYRSSISKQMVKETTILFRLKISKVAFKHLSGEKTSQSIEKEIEHQRIVGRKKSIIGERRSLCIGERKKNL